MCPLSRVTQLTQTLGLQIDPKPTLCTAHAAGTSLPNRLALPLPDQGPGDGAHGSSQLVPPHPIQVSLRATGISQQHGEGECPHRCQLPWPLAATEPSSHPAPRFGSLLGQVMDAT